MEDATEHAEHEVDADPFTALDWVYADPAAGEPPPPWHPRGPGETGEGAH